MKKSPFAVLRARLMSSVAEQSDDASRSSQIQSLRELVEAEKLVQETSNLSRAARAEASRFWFGVLAPLVSAAALVGTLVLQIRQSNENARMQRDSAEAASFRATLDKLSSPDPYQSMLGAIQLETFLDSTTLGRQSRRAAVVMLSSLTLYDSFELLLGPLVTRTDSSNVADIITIGRKLNRIYGIERARAQKIGNAEDERRARLSNRGIAADQPFGPELEQSQRTQEELALEISLVSDKLAVVLYDKPLSGLNLSGFPFWNTKLTKVDLRGANLTGVTVFYCDVSGVDLGGISRFKDSDWPQTAWWRAQAVSKDLFVYLRERFPFTDGVEYAGGAADQEQYQRDLKRLTQNFVDGAEGAATSTQLN